MAAPLYHTPPTHIKLSHAAKAAACGRLGSQALLFQVLVDDVDQFLSGFRVWIAAGGIRVDHVLANMVLDDFGYKAVHGAPTGGRLLQDHGALLIGLDRTFDSLNLTAQPPDPIQQLGFLLATWLMVQVPANLGGGRVFHRYIGRG